MRVPALEGHRLWARVYDLGTNPLLALERRAMWNVLEPLQAKKVIDVACGTGQWLLHLQQGGSDVFGCDLCQEMLDEAQKIFSLRGRLARADAECIPFRTSMADLVLCSVSLGYFHDLDRAVLEFARALKPGGYIAISDLHPDASSAGWSRSFKLGEQRYELQHYRRSIHEITSAACGAGLQPKLHRDVYFGAAEMPIFQCAGKQELFSSLLTTPALFIGLWEKPCC